MGEDRCMVNGEKRNAKHPGLIMGGAGPTRYIVKMSWPGTTSLGLGICS